ncbi:hypothetical protein ACHWQZ_G017655 [Mnemiopsis leidyi]
MALSTVPSDRCCIDRQQGLRYPLVSLIAPKRAVVVPDIIRDGCKSLNSLKKRTNCQSPEKNRFVLISFRFKSDSLMLKSKSLINDQFNRQ